VHIDRGRVGKGKDRYGYRSLEGRMLSLKVVTRYGSARAECAMEFVRQLDYPLMFVRKVERGKVKKVYSRKPISDAGKSVHRGKARDHR